MHQENVNRDGLGLFFSVVSRPVVILWKCSWFDEHFVKKQIFRNI